MFCFPLLATFAFFKRWKLFEIGGFFFNSYLVIKFNSTGNSLDEGESRGLGFDSLQLLPLILGDMRGNKRMFGLNVGEWSIGLSRHGLPLLVSGGWWDASLLLELWDHLESVINDFVSWKTAGNHVSCCTAIIDHHQCFPGDTFLSVKNSVFFADFSRSISEEGNLTFSFQSTISPVILFIRIWFYFKSCLNVLKIVYASQAFLHSKKESGELFRP